MTSVDLPDPKPMAGGFLGWVSTVEALYDIVFDELEIALLEALSLQSTLLSRYLSFAVFEPMRHWKG